MNEGSLGNTESGLHAHGVRRLAGSWLIVGLLAAVSLALSVELVRGIEPAKAQLAAPEGSGRILAVVGQITSDSYGLYLVDLESGIITLYQWQPGARKLRLLAARNTTFDLQLDEFNTTPSPNEIEKLVRQSRRLGSGAEPR